MKSIRLLFSVCGLRWHPFKMNYYLGPRVRIALEAGTGGELRPTESAEEPTPKVTLRTLRGTSFI